MPWSFSALDTYERCGYRYKLKFIDRIKEPEPTDKDKDARLRGINIHKELELYVTGEIPELPQSARFFGPQMDQLRELYTTGAVEVEGTWLFDKNWQPFDGKFYDAWGVIKADVWVNGGTFGVVIDHKSGKKFGNEPKHAQQLNTYVVGAFFKYPDLHTIEGEVWYHDANDMLRITYRRDQAMAFLPRLEARVNTMLEDTRHRPRPSAVNCKYCPYSPRGTGHCPVGV